MMRVDWWLSLLDGFANHFGIPTSYDLQTTKSRLNDHHLMSSKVLYTDQCPVSCKSFVLIMPQAQISRIVKMISMQRVPQLLSS